MGAGSSSLSAPKTITNDELKSGSEDIRRMSNALFQYMYTKWEPKDVWEIANNPSNYVIALSDLITTQFHVLGYTRKDGKLGEIYFKEWKDLKPPMSTGDYAKEAQNAKNSNNTRRIRRQRNDKNYEIQKQNSEIIAFYFVRIFQILGALLLVVKDFNMPSFNPETGEEVVATSNNASRNFAHQAYQVVSAFKSPSMKGGARMSFEPSMPLGPYDFLRFYLRQADEDDISNFKTKGHLLDRKREFMFEGSDTMIFEFTPYKDVAEIRADTKPSQRIGILVKNSANGIYEKAYIPVFVSDIQFDLNDGGFVNMIQGYKAPAERPEKERETAYPREVVLDMVLPEKSGGNNKVTFTRIGKTKSLNLGFEYQVTRDSKKFVDNLLLVMPSMKRSDFVKMLERVLISGLRLTRSELEDVIFEKKIETEATGAEKNKPKPPNNKSLKDTFGELVKDNYQPHCIARALQLLDSASISGKFKNRSGNTKVCKDALGGKSSMKLSEYTPTRSFGQLFGKINPIDYQSSINVLKAFVQKDSTGNPLSADAVGNFPSEKDELQAAIKRLTTAFNIVYSDQKDLASVEVKISSKCDPKDIGKDIEIKNTNTINEMRTASQKLLAYHLAQIRRISEFLKKIFNITQRGDGSWKVEGPKTELLFAGFEVMNDLTNQARALLLDYYAGCEEIYQGGLKAWEATAAPAANRGSPGPGAVLPSAPRAPSAPPSGPVPPAAPAPPGGAGGPAPPAVGGRRRRKSK